MHEVGGRHIYTHTHTKMPIKVGSDTVRLVRSNSPKQSYHILHSNASVTTETSEQACSDSCLISCCLICYLLISLCSSLSSSGPQANKILSIFLNFWDINPCMRAHVLMVLSDAKECWCPTGIEAITRRYLPARLVPELSGGRPWRNLSPVRGSCWNSGTHSVRAEKASSRENRIQKEDLTISVWFYLIHALRSLDYLIAWFCS